MNKSRHKRPTVHNLVWASQIIRLSLIKTQPHLAAKIQHGDLLGPGFVPDMRNVRYAVRMVNQRGVLGKPVEESLTGKERRDLATAWNYMDKQNRIMSKERFAR